MFQPSKQCFSIGGTRGTWREGSVGSDVSKIKISFNDLYNIKMYMKTTVLWDIMRCSSLRARSFEGRCRLNFQGWRVGEARNQLSSPPHPLASRGLFLGLLFDPENRGVLFLTVFFIFTAARTSDPAQNVRIVETVTSWKNRSFLQLQWGYFLFLQNDWRDAELGQKYSEPLL